jgi:integrase
MPTLTDIDVRNSKPGEYTDANGLMLIVRASSIGKPRRTWVLRVVDGGRRRKIGLGAYPTVSLADARRKAQDARRALADGVDPSATAKRRQHAARQARSLTFGQAVEDYLAKAAPTFKNAKSEDIRNRALRTHFAPLHGRDVGSITVADVAGILKPLAPQTAIKAHSAVRAVFDYAAAKLEPHGVVIMNAADPRRLRAVGWSPKSARSAAPHPALDWRQMSKFMIELAQHDDISARCLTFAILTVARAGAARLAKWRDVDLERGLWFVPVANLKDSKHRTAPFVVPLSASAIRFLEALPKNGAFVFPNAVDKPIDDQSIVHLIRRMHRRGEWKDQVTGKPIVAHGFRSSFRTWAKAKRLDREIAELSMGHAFYKAAENPYARDDDEVLALRRRMLEAWGRHCDGRGAEVVAFLGKILSTA